MKKTQVLFVCIHNSVRSQMAEAWLNHLCGDQIRAQSAEWCLELCPALTDSEAVTATR